MEKNFETWKSIYLSEITQKKNLTQADNIILSFYNNLSSLTEREKNTFKKILREKHKKELSEYNINYELSKIREKKAKQLKTKKQQQRLTYEIIGSVIAELIQNNHADSEQIKNIIIQNMNDKSSKEKTAVLKLFNL